MQGIQTKQNVILKKAIIVFFIYSIDENSIALFANSSLQRHYCYKNKICFTSLHVCSRVQLPALTY